jgi:hypothetical protein
MTEWKRAYQRWLGHYPSVKEVAESMNIEPLLASAFEHGFHAGVRSQTEAKEAQEKLK